MRCKRKFYGNFAVFGSINRAAFYRTRRRCTGLYRPHRCVRQCGKRHFVHVSAFTFARCGTRGVKRGLYRDFPCAVSVLTFGNNYCYSAVLRSVDLGTVFFVSGGSFLHCPCFRVGQGGNIILSFRTTASFTGADSHTRSSFGGIGSQLPFAVLVSVTTDSQTHYENKNQC